MDIAGKTGNPKIVVIGGGTGISTLLRGMKKYTPNLTAIVTMFDNGGSSGILRQEFSYPPFGDLRQCLLALGEETKDTRAIRQAFDFRFGRESSLNGHNVGNLLLAALTSLSNDLELALEEISRVLGVVGRVVPVALDRAELCAELDDGSTILGESNIDLRAASLPHIKKIYLEPQVGANPKALEAIAEADVVALGPGDLYTSVLPNLLAKGMPEALASSKAIKVYMCNLMTKLGETDGFRASDFVREIAGYLRPQSLDWAIVNNCVFGDFVKQAYAAEGARVVEPDLGRVNGHVSGVIATSLALDELPLRHDSDRAARAVLEALDAGRVRSDDVHLQAVSA